MRAAILVKQKKPLVIANIELPRKLGYGQVLVKILFTTICGSQLNEIDGTKGKDKFLPHLLGHEASGVVEKIGPGVTQVNKGDKVVLHWRKNPSGIQSATPNYKYKNKVINAGWVTTFQEKSIVSENRLTKIPSDSDLWTAPLYGCNLTTAYGIIHRDAGMKIGDSILIFGSGGLGISVVIMAKLLNARDITVVDISDYKLKMAKNYGADKVINSKKRIGVLGFFDVVVDTTGIKSVREKAFEHTSKTGVCVLAGVPHHTEKMCFDSLQIHFDKKITGSHGGDSIPERDIPRIMSLERKGCFSLGAMITKTYPLDKINKAIREVRKGKVIKCMIDISLK